MRNPRRSLWTRVISLIAIVFGVLTIREGGLVLLGDEVALEAAGSYVPFVLWFNVLAGFAYVVAGVGLWMERQWSAKLAFTIVLGTAIVFAAFGVHVCSGGAYEQRTVIAMGLRTFVWAAIAMIAWQRLRSRR